MLDFQKDRTLNWLRHVFIDVNPSILVDVEERALRFGEETIELTQADGLTREQWHALVDQVFDKPVGEPMQELGGVMVTLAAYLAVTNRSANAAFETEFDRCEQPETIEKIRRKHATKAVVSSGFRPTVVANHSPVAVAEPDAEATTGLA